MKAEGRTVEEPGLFVSQLRWRFSFVNFCWYLFQNLWTSLDKSYVREASHMFSSVFYRLCIHA